jgi:MOSC domain-containing protein YiiM
MFKGTVTSIHITAEKGGDILDRDSVRAVTGKGLEGDRNFDNGKPHRAVTLIERESIDALARDYNVTLKPADSRRNIVTVGVPLNHLVGQEFTVGGVRMRGTELCEPCNYLAGKTEAKVLPGLVHRGGLRAEVLSEGDIRIGDSIEVL